MHIELIIHSADPDALEQLRGVVRELREESHTVNGRVTFERGDAERFARAATRNGTDLIIAAGGDGTLNEVVNGIFNAGAGSVHRRPRLGIAPLGTANDLAAWLELPVEPAEAVRRAIDSQPRIIDVGRLNDRFFLNVSTGGFGANATEETHEKVKKALGTLAYVITGVRKFASLEPSRARFLSAGEIVFEGDFLFFAVGNGRRTGGGNCLTPLADLGDGFLDFCLLRAVSHGEFLRMLSDLRSGAHIDSEHVIYRQLADLRVEPAGEIRVNADGEPVDAAAFAYSVIPGALRLAAPGRILA